MALMSLAPPLLVVGAAAVVDSVVDFVVVVAEAGVVLGCRWCC